MSDQVDPVVDNCRLVNKDVKCHSLRHWNMLNAVTQSQLLCNVVILSASDSKKLGSHLDPASIMIHVEGNALFNDTLNVASDI